MKTNSPFLVVEEFISPARCEILVNELGLSVPCLDAEKENQPMKHERMLAAEEYAAPFKTMLLDLNDRVQQKYGAPIQTIEVPLFQQYFENPAKPCELHGCESSRFLRKKWVKYRDIDLVGFLWLKDFHSGVPLDPRFEVFGGKLEFPAYNFSLVPQRGTLVLYPAGPHFITAISPILVGSLEQVKFTLKLDAGDGFWQYNPQNFPGTYHDWFEE